jgi:hypothetical protein
VRFNHHSISTIEETFYMLHSYIEAHTHAQEEVCAFFGEVGIRMDSITCS